MALPRLWLGLLSHALMGVTKIPLEENLCTTVPCRLAFPKEPLDNSMIMGYWLNKNVSAPVATNKSNVIIDDHNNGRFHILWNLEERDCTLLIHNVLKRDDATYLSAADLQEQKTAFLRENITLFLSDIPMARASVTLTCTIRSSCIAAKARFLSWKEPATSFNTDGSRNSSVSSSVLHFTPKPKDRGTTLQCYLNFPLSNSTAVRFPVIMPATLLYYVCSLEKIPQCNCSFYGIPTPFVQWLMDGVPVIKKNMSDTFQVTTTITAPWANSTIRFTGKPEEVMSLRCEGKNKYGIQEASIFLVPDESSVPILFVKGLIQGIVYGVIIPALFYFFLVLLLFLKWWVKRQIPKEEEALILKKPELLEEPETSKETKDTTSTSWAGEKSLERLEPRPSTSQEAALLRPSTSAL
ncbi:myelin-associated glycoprotein isoform X2 [Eptesicus fuscus]|uniref:myelin-associated glycoprotein isoform X2 n=1 Tax=Eptesicus fuscus TaxID=29078 RepID=UPI002403BC2A|nr:myelin-associated glycoprotein isoform X2 [Eptesicus fuscus]